MNDAEFEIEMQKALENEARTGDGARSAEEYFAGQYKKQWHQIWADGRQAQEQGKNREDNPHKLKVWRAVWEYGWDNYDPNKPFEEFAKVEKYLKTLPTRPFTIKDFTNS